MYRRYLTTETRETTPRNRKRFSDSWVKETREVYDHKREQAGQPRDYFLRQKPTEAMREGGNESIHAKIEALEDRLVSEFEGQDD